jgi:hypothetical protein
MNEDSNYIDFGLIEANRSSFYQTLIATDALSQRAKKFDGNGHVIEVAIKKNLQTAAQILSDLERDYASDIANMRRQLEDVRAGHKTFGY